MEKRKRRKFTEDFPKIFSGDALTVPLTLLLDETGAVVEAVPRQYSSTREIEDLQPA